MDTKIYFSIDLESWAYPNDSRFTGLASNARKEIDNGFVLESINRILDLLAKYNQQITFFAIAEIFEWYPEAFMRIKKAGHEITYHTHKHTRIIGSEVMKGELAASKDFLREFSPTGFRAPEIYLPRKAIRPLMESGFRYSSSVYGNHADIFQKEEGLLELPISTFSYAAHKSRILNYPRPISLGMLFKEVPFGAGYFVAVLPLRFIEKSIESYLKINKPVFIFAHNWQIIGPKGATFPDFKYKLTHPAYLPYTIKIKNKIEYLLERYPVGRMNELVCNQENIGIKK